jgi:hypothetical protein
MSEDMTIHFQHRTSACRPFLEAIYFPFIGSAFKVETMYIDYEIVCSFYLFQKFEECLLGLFLVIWS